MTSLPFVCKSGMKKKSSEKSSVWVGRAEGECQPELSEKEREREMQSHKGVVIFFKVYVREWRAAEMKWAALATASRILDAEKKSSFLRCVAGKIGGRGGHREVSHQVAWFNSTQSHEMQLLINLCPVRVTTQYKPEPPTSTSITLWSRFTSRGGLCHPRSAFKYKGNCKHSFGCFKKFITIQTTDMNFNWNRSKFEHKCSFWVARCSWSSSVAKITLWTDGSRGATAPSLIMIGVMLYVLSVGHLFLFELKKQRRPAIYGHTRAPVAQVGPINLNFHNYLCLISSFFI